VIGDRRLLVDMTFVTDVDEQGRELITRWHRDGARLIANSKASRALAESIVSERSLNEDDGPASDRTWHPFRASFLGSAITLLVLAMVMFSV